jgi:hypothetical protein
LGYFNHPFIFEKTFSLTRTIFSFSPLGYFSHPFLSRIFFFSPLGYFYPFSSRILFHSHRQFFFLSIGLFLSVFIQNFFSFTRTIFLSLHWAILAIRFCSRRFLHSHGQFVRAATRRLGESKKGGHQDLPTNHDQLALHPIELGTAGDCLTRVIRVGGCVVCPTNV